MKQIDINNSIEPSKRNFLKIMGSLAIAGVVSPWIANGQANAMQIPPSERLPNFPLDILLFRQEYKNWSGESQLENAWTCTPKSQEEVIRVINWAHKNGYRVRAKGMSHNWSPIMLDDQDKTAKVILVDMVSYINRIEVVSTGLITVETGAQMENLLDAMQSRGFGFVATPAPGDLTVGGVLAIDGHGTGIPALSETRLLGQTYGSLSNLIISITAVVFDASTQTYVPKLFTRDEQDIGALLVHLGRAFILSVQLQSSVNQYLRCESFTHIHINELFAADSKSGRTFSHYLDKSGRVEAIWFPFTEYPWLKIWSISPQKPTTSRLVNQPFNYVFSDNLPETITDFINNIIVGNQGYLTPAFGQFQLQLSTLGLNGSPFSGISTILTGGLISSQSRDLWGASKDLLLYVKPTTLRVTANGYAVITSRNNVQRVIHDFCENYKQRVDNYKKNDRYPMNGPVEIRVTGLDHPEDSIIPNAQTPILSAIKPCPDHPEWDCAVWFDILTLPGTSYAAEFYAETEQWMLQRYQGDSLIRPEWSKGWGYTTTNAWADPIYIKQHIPESHATGQPNQLTLETAKTILDRLDPYRLFTSPLLDQLL
ncbi:cholesterol oxidase substrate-binding domain-containing protein [Acinetobacter oleivorans]|uniref:cholesterol oxidase substrate-binding domain-containing protein n=1 Tax=Acinetobacter oleivorans TaxID=1148157 RepID=UPI001CD48F24|nr:cholesterol oxidase substrate-binding domain-containing protein [Acinetobacter oleivorans]